MSIIFLSNQLFDYPLKTNKWHVATRVAAIGHDVLFVDPPIRFRKFLKQIFQGRWSLRRILTFNYRPQKNLIVYTPVGLVPKLYPFGRRLETIFGRLKKRTRNILWVYHVEMGGLEKFIEKIPRDLLIYDCVDNYPAFPRYRDKPELREWVVAREKWLAKKADLIFTTAPGLQERLSKLNPNTHYVGNAGDYGRFHLPGGERRSEVELHLRGGISIGFSGAIDSYKVNLPLLVKIAKAYPKYSLVLVGPTGVADDEPNLKELESLPNVRLLGEKPYEEMPQYFSQFDIYIIPFNLNEYTVGGCFPVKFFDALAAGLPTVVTNLPCYQDFSKVCYTARDEKDFIRLVKAALEENSTDKISARQKVAKENSWDIKVDRMLSIIKSLEV